MGFEHCGGIDWYTALRNHGARDCFDGTRYQSVELNAAKPYGPYAKSEAPLCSFSWCMPAHSVGMNNTLQWLRFWLLRLDNFSDKPGRLREDLRTVLKEYGQRLGGKPNTPLPGSATQYRTFQCSKWPCNCAYIYGGINARKYKFYQYLRRDMVIDTRNSGITGTSDGPVGTCCDSMLELVGGALLWHIGSSLEDADFVLPNYVVANDYEDQTKCIGPHSDDDPLFDALASDSVIFSVNVARDGVFGLRPKNGKEFANAFGLRKGDKGDWDLAVYAPENSVFVMGGRFQFYLHHWSFSHDDFVEGTELRRCQFGEQVRDQYLKAEKYGLLGWPRQAWDLYERLQITNL